MSKVNQKSKKGAIMRMRGYQGEELVASYMYEKGYKITMAPKLNTETYDMIATNDNEKLIVT